MLRVAEVDIAYDVYYPPVGLLRKAFVKASVSCLHVEDGDMESLGSYDTQAAVGITENQYGIGLDCGHQLVGGVDDITHGGAKVIANGIHIDLRVFQFKILEEDSIEVIVVVLPCMGKDGVEVFSAFADDSCKTDDFGPCAYYYQQLQSAVVLPCNVVIVVIFHLLFFK